MPVGVYKRTKPKTLKQIEAARKTGKLPFNSLKQKEHVQKLAQLPRSLKQLKGKIFGNDTIEHHNDLCHGAKKPDDVTLMTMREHSRLHARLRKEDGIIPFLKREND